MTGEQFIKDHFVEFGQGMQSMSPALRDLEQVLLERELAHGNHLVLTMCISNTHITLDDAGKALVRPLIGSKILNR